MVPSWCTAVWKVTAGTVSVPNQGMWVPELQPQEGTELWMLATLLHSVPGCRLQTPVLPSLQPVSPLSTSKVEAVE